jgi:excisionase family DNA binding protein
MTKRLTMTIPEAAEKLGVGRNQCYQAAKAGTLPTIKIGKRVLVPIAALEDKLLHGTGPKITAKHATK